MLQVEQRFRGLELCFYVRDFLETRDDDVVEERSPSSVQRFAMNGRTEGILGTHSEVNSFPRCVANTKPVQANKSNRNEPSHDFICHLIIPYYLAFLLKKKKKKKKIEYKKIKK